MDAVSLHTDQKYSSFCSATNLEMYVFGFKYLVCLLGFEGRIPRVESQCTGLRN